MTFDNPFGHAGHRLHEWMFATRFGHELLGKAGGSNGVDQAFAERTNLGIGAEIMGAGKFGPPGWQHDETWRGWWGPNPPFHTPVFVMTHHSFPPMAMDGGTTFHFIDGSPHQALERAQIAAGSLDVRVGGGPSTVRAFLDADLIDTLHVVQVPILLGRGTRLWDGQEALEERFNVEAVSTPSGVTHFSFTRR
jgi:dihydrofolate reductase